MKPRDLTKAQFDAACERHGFVERINGMYDVGHGVHVIPVGNSRRKQLAYLIREAQRAEKARETK